MVFSDEEFGGFSGWLKGGAATTGYDRTGVAGEEERSEKALWELRPHKRRISGSLSQVSLN